MILIIMIIISSSPSLIIIIITCLVDCYVTYADCASSTIYTSFILLNR
jgi:hypothetical protein